MTKTSRRNAALTVLTLGAALLSANAAAAAAPNCTPDPRVAPAVAQWLEKKQFQPITPLDTAQARCFKQAFVNGLAPHLGRRVGVKVGLFSKAARAAYQTETPRLGYLYAGMLLPNGSTVPMTYAITGTYESDLLLVVGDERINTAQTREQLYGSLRGFRPFIELPDRSYAFDAKINADMVEALDVGARLGVMGAEQPLPKTGEAMNRLVNFSVEVASAVAGETKIEKGNALDSLGDVIEILRFARDQVLAEGGHLKKGDVVSIGVVTPARPPIAGQTLTIRYDVLAAPSTVSVTFR
jgi:2-keto-4-pentenoate hydratase